MYTYIVLRNILKHLHFAFLSFLHVYNVITIQIISKKMLATHLLIILFMEVNVYIYIFFFHAIIFQIYHNNLNVVIRYY